MTRMASQEWKQLAPAMRAPFLRQLATVIVERRCALASTSSALLRAQQACVWPVGDNERPVSAAQIDDMLSQRAETAWKAKMQGISHDFEQDFGVEVDLQRLAQEPTVVEALRASAKGFSHLERPSCASEHFGVCRTKHAAVFQSVLQMGRACAGLINELRRNTWGRSGRD